jgi:uncharacterized membrane protein
MTRKILIFEILTIAMVVAASLEAYPHLPDSVPTHWDMNLQPNGFSSRLALVWVGPGLLIATILATWLLPWLSPAQFQVDNFRETYRRIMVILFCVGTYFYAVTLWPAFGQTVEGGRAILGGCCLLLALLGNLMGKVRRNFYIGIRTPWAIANERVWNATHRFAGKTMFAGGLAGLAFTLLSLNSWTLFALLSGALAPAIYSLVYYKQLERRGELGDPLARG